MSSPGCWGVSRLLLHRRRARARCHSCIDITPNGPFYRKAAPKLGDEVTAVDAPAKELAELNAEIAAPHAGAATRCPACASSSRGRGGIT